MNYPHEMKHIVVYRKEDEFAGWPFNGGMWQFQDGELLLGFFRGACDYKSPGCAGHRKVDVEHCLIRSKDGGETWPIESMSTVYPNRRAFADSLRTLSPPAEAKEVFDPNADGFCLISGFGIPPADAPYLAFTLLSTDRGKSWKAKQRLPIAGPDKGQFGHLGGRPSTVVRKDGMLLLFVHGSRSPQEKPSVPLVYASSDGGGSWGLLAEVEPKPRLPMAIMPYPLLFRDDTLLMAVRRQYDFQNAFTQVYASEDLGRTWHFKSRVNDWGAPANLLELEDGRLICVYGVRRPPYGIRARWSDDQGESWGPELVLRDDGGSADLGYPRSLLRDDGTIVTAYYFNEAKDPVQFEGGVRHIAVTLWRP